VAANQNTAKTRRRQLIMMAALLALISGAAMMFSEDNSKYQPLIPVLKRALQSSQAGSGVGNLLRTLQNERQ
jgi:hypothetical protein